MQDNSVRKKVILIRHARIAENDAGVYAGRRTDVSLSEAGAMEALAEKERIRQLAGDATVFSGPMKRALETARILFDDRVIEVEDELTEIDFGVFEGRSYDELENDPRFGEWVDSGCMMTLPGGESVSEFCERSICGLHNILHRAGDAESIAIVCHGGNIMAIMSELSGEEYFTHKVGNIEGYVLTFDWDDERISAVTYDRHTCGSPA